jgi:hypothetical protein
VYYDPGMACRRRRDGATRPMTSDQIGGANSYNLDCKIALTRGRAVATIVLPRHMKRLIPRPFRRRTMTITMVSTCTNTAAPQHNRGKPSSHCGYRGANQRRQ